MHRLCRYVRFCVNPFLAQDAVGYNSYSAKPAGEGLAIYLELGVELAGELETETGFVVNVSNIDRVVRECAIPIITDRIRNEYTSGRHVGLVELKETLILVRGKLHEKFGRSKMSKLSLKLNPRREIAVDSDEEKLVYFSEKFEFAATHKLWNETLSNEENFAKFGKCASPNGHGHNYVVEVTVKAPAESLSVSAFERVVSESLIDMIDHKNLNVDLEHFGRVNPTVENIAVFAWQTLNGKFPKANLHCVTVWETDRTYCSYYG